MFFKFQIILEWLKKSRMKATQLLFKSCVNIQQFNTICQFHVNNAVHFGAAPTPPKTRG